MSNGLDEALGEHITEFQDIHRITPSNFDLLIGDSCLRVCVYAPEFPTRILDEGYIANDFGFDSLDDLRHAVQHILMKKYL